MTRETREAMRAVLVLLGGAAFVWVCLKLGGFI
jgi:hypothetical protein